MVVGTWGTCSSPTRCGWRAPCPTRHSSESKPLRCQVDAQDAQKQLAGQSCNFDGATGTLVVVMGSPFQLNALGTLWTNAMISATRLERLRPAPAPMPTLPTDPRGPGEGWLS